MTLTEIPVESRIKMALLNEGSISVEAYQTKDGLRILYSVDKTPKGVLRHLSVSRADRYPHWVEIPAKQATERLKLLIKNGWRVEP